MLHYRSTRAAAGFSLIELLVVIAIVAVLVGLLVPSLAGVRAATRTAKCSSNQRQMITAWHLYANDYKERAMPLAYWALEDIGSGPQIFWWGTHGTSSTPPDYERGFIAPYMASSLHDGSVFECPSQPWGTYRPQGPSRTITSTYGYNGYYLSPSKTPGWAFSIAHRPWKRVSSIEQPTSLIVFADTLLPSVGAAMPSNNALLDPPLLFSSGAWTPNPSPTTAFRHQSAAVASHADGHVRPISAEPAWLTHPAHKVGSVGGAATNGPFYIPDWTIWTAR